MVINEGEFLSIPVTFITTSTYGNRHAARIISPSGKSHGNQRDLFHGVYIFKPRLIIEMAKRRDKLQLYRDVLVVLGEFPQGIRLTRLLSYSGVQYTSFTKYMGILMRNEFVNTDGKRYFITSKGEIAMGVLSDLFKVFEMEMGLDKMHIALIAARVQELIP